MKQRLEEFLKAEKLSKAQFADSIRVARAGISHIMAGRNNPSYEFIVNTMDAYPYLNIEWLLCGRGSMYKNGYADAPDESATPSDGIFSPVEEPEVVEETPLPPCVPERVQRENAAPKGGKRILILYEDGTYEEFC